MPTLQVDDLHFNFVDTVAAQIYDEWRHYKQVWRHKHGGQKGVDVVAVENRDAPATMWLIEVKDFRNANSVNPPKPSNIGGLADQVAEKVADTLAGLADASANAAVASERNHANIALVAPAQRVVLHLEPHTGAHSALFPAGFAANVIQKLRQLVKNTDPNPLVLNIANTPAASVPWTVSP